MTLKLTDDFHQDEPLAYLVKCPASCVTCEYKVFADVCQAASFARRNGEDENLDWEVYPLYAGRPLSIAETRKFE